MVTEKEAKEVAEAIKISVYGYDVEVVETCVGEWMVQII